jgi:N6-L-threonylcarbamoyladenine synthase
MLVLGIETSCDETAVGIVEDRFTLRANVVASQVELHAPYGGVVPEVAARAHLELLVPSIDQALVEAGARISDVDAIAVTAGPGLIGALLVGVSSAKGLALAHDLPLLGVNHLRAHVEAAQLEHGELAPPLVALVVSGGHTSIVAMGEDGVFRQLGGTIDDAAGEAFDKAAKLLGLGYPGGPAIQRVAADGDPAAHPLPRPMLDPSQRPDSADYFDFSFSGLKTALLNRVRQLEAEGNLAGEVPGLAAAFQSAVVDVLAAKTMRAVELTGCRRVVLGGGVAASEALRAELSRRLDGWELHHPSPRMSTDNGAMIARAALFHHGRGDAAPLDLSARPDLPFPGLTGRGPDRPLRAASGC